MTSNNVNPGDEITTSTSLPSIESLFGLRREDDLDSLLSPDDPHRRSSHLDPSKPPVLGSLPDAQFNLNELEKQRNGRGEAEKPQPRVSLSIETSGLDTTSRRRHAQTSDSISFSRGKGSSSGVVLPLFPPPPTHAPPTSNLTYSPRSEDTPAQDYVYPLGLPGEPNRGRSLSDVGPTPEDIVVDRKPSPTTYRSMHRPKLPTHQRDQQNLKLSSAPYNSPHRYQPTSQSTSLGSSTATQPPPPPAFSRHLSFLSDPAFKRRHTISDGRPGKHVMEDDRRYKAPPRLPPLSSTSQAHLDRQLQSQLQYGDSRIVSPLPSSSQSSSVSELSLRHPLRIQGHSSGSRAWAPPQEGSPTTPYPTGTHRSEAQLDVPTARSSPPSTQFQSPPPSAFPRRLSTASSVAQLSLSSPTHSTARQQPQHHHITRPQSPPSTSPFAYGVHDGSSTQGLARRTSASSSSDYGHSFPPRTTSSGRPRSAASLEGSFSGYDDDLYEAGGAEPSTANSNASDFSGSSSHALSRPSTAGAAKYECDYCQKRFNRPSSLKIHVNTHTGDKPFKCPFPGCGRRFSVSSNMRRHSRVHTQPKNSMNPAANPFASAPPTFSLNQAEDGMELDYDDEDPIEGDSISHSNWHHGGVSTRKTSMSDTSISSGRPRRDSGDSSLRRHQLRQHPVYSRPSTSPGALTSLSQTPASSTTSMLSKKRGKRQSPSINDSPTGYDDDGGKWSRGTNRRSRSKLDLEGG